MICTNLALNENMRPVVRTGSAYHFFKRLKYSSFIFETLKVISGDIKKRKTIWVEKSTVR